jgi:UDP-N-acetylglucosamine transferase subunit ALG13
MTIGYVFVTVGSTDFDLLTRAVDDLCAPGHLLANYDVEMQIGEGTYEPAHTRFFRFAPSLPYFERADLVIAHGGLGTAVEAIGCGCRLLAVANPDRYDHHQEDLLGALAEAGNLMWCADLEHLEEQVQAALQFEPQPYVCPPCSIHEVIGKFLREKSHRVR